MRFETVSKRIVSVEHGYKSHMSLLQFVAVCSRYEVFVEHGYKSHMNLSLICLKVNRLR